MPKLSIPDAVQLALEQHRSGKIESAESAYRRILEQQPNHADVLHLLGVLVHQQGRHTEGETLVRRAIEHDPQPIYFSSLGLILAALDRHDDAVSAYQQALKLDANFPEAWNNLANSQRAIGQSNQAMANYRKALELRPDYADARQNLAAISNQLSEKQQWGDAIEGYRKVVELEPNSAETLNNLGTALRMLGQWHEAINCYRRSLEVKPDDPDTLNNVGNAYCDIGQWDSAINAYKQAIVLNSQHAESWNNLGTAWLEKSDWPQALKCYEQALKLQPDSHQARWNLALLQLLLGDFENGLPGYESRFFLPEQQPFARHFTRPVWNGEPLNGQRILIHAEQGFGDTIQYARFVPMVVQRGGNVIFECQPEVLGLMQTLEDSDSIQFIPRGQPIRDFDLHCPVLSLPLKFNITLANIPAKFPYLRADAAAKWQERFKVLNGLKVGLVWAGTPIHQKDRLRSIPFESLSPLLDMQNIKFISLQKDQPTDRMLDWTGDLHDFADTAGLLANLDLIISVDTAVAHLAGALGKPIWLLLQKVPDPRWLLNRDDSPWYPTMRLFRQTEAGRWDDPIAQVAAELGKLAIARSAG